VPLRVTNWKKYTDEYDLIIWVVPVPSKKKLFPGWEDLYNLKKSQVMVIHDGNLNKLYPHAYDVMPMIRAVVGVHDCAYNSIKENTAWATRLIPNPQIITRMRDVNFKNRDDSVFSAQTFKRWKRVDDLVRAVPDIRGRVRLAGGGIEYHYMTGEKQKPEYEGIWKRAIDSGMNYLGYVTSGTMDDLLAKSKLLVDPSWSKNYAQYGSHFNRTFVDGIINGCLPAGRDLLMDGNSFFPNEDYVTIPYNATPQEFAEKVNEALALTDRQYTKKVRALQEQVRLHFDSVLVAKQYLDFA
jgi:glycosyltransferase involved in cell wall biosynthesis